MVLIGLGGPFESDTETLVVGYFILFCGLLILGVIIAGIYQIIDSQTGHWQEGHGKIIHHTYVGATSSTGFGVAMGSNGASPVMTSSSSPEEFIVFVQSDSGIVKINVSMAAYFSYKDNGNLIYWTKFGGLSKSVISHTIKNPMK